VSPHVEQARCVSRSQPRGLALYALSYHVVSCRIMSYHVDSDPASASVRMIAKMIAKIR